MPPAWIAIALCAGSAVLEGACAGTDVKKMFASLRAPKYSAPLPVWYAIGALYYAVFGFAAYRVLLLPPSTLRTTTLALIVSMMVVNGLWNLLFFRVRNLYAAFVTGSAAPLLDVPLMLLLWRADRMAAFVLIPYLVYRVYAMWWGYALWKENRI